MLAVTHVLRYCFLLPACTAAIQKELMEMVEEGGLLASLDLESLSNKDGNVNENVTKQ